MGRDPCRAMVGAGVLVLAADTVGRPTMRPRRRRGSCVRTPLSPCRIPGLRRVEAAGPSWGRETAVNSGQPRCPTDNQTYSSSAVIGGDRAAGPYMACKGSGVQIPSARDGGECAVDCSISPDRPSYPVRAKF
jgi:hypothetical protein